MMPFISINGHLVSAGNNNISSFDRGFTLGDGLFETIKLEHGIPWYLDRHLARLERSAQYVGIHCPKLLRSWIAEAITETSEVHDSSLVLRVTLTRGIAPISGLTSNNDIPPTVVLTIVPAPTFSARIYEIGISACVASAPRNERAFAAGIKTTSYIEPILAMREAVAAGYDDTIFLDTRGFVSEASTSNIFAWIDNTLVTPSLNCGVLPGITRAIVLELANQQGAMVEERMLTLYELANAHEVFCTSSLRGIVPLVQLVGQPIRDGKPGTRTRDIMAEYTTRPTRT